MSKLSLVVLIGAVASLVTFTQYHVTSKKSSCLRPFGRPQAETLFGETPPRIVHPVRKATQVEPIIGVEYLKTQTDTKNLHFVVSSEIYDEDPDTMFLTLRGGGISVYNVSTPSEPTLLSHYDTEDVEGQDRIGNTLVIVARKGKLVTLDVSDRTVSPRMLGSVDLITDPNLMETAFDWVNGIRGNPFAALQVKLWSSGGKTYAFVTATASGELIAVDVTQPELPKQVGQIDTGVQYIEGIYIKDGFAFVGGFGRSKIYQAVDVRHPSNMILGKALQGKELMQMNSDMDPTCIPNTLFAALGGDNGGVGAFDVTNPSNVTVVDEIVHPLLGQANRVKISGASVLLPLKQSPGGLAVINSEDRSNLRLTGIARGLEGVDTPRTLQPNGDYLYVFGAETSSMATFKLHRGAEKLIFGRFRISFITHRDILQNGLTADKGLGTLRFPDRFTYRHSSFGTVNKIHYVELDPSKTWVSWQRGSGIFLEHAFGKQTIVGNVPRYTLVWDLFFPEWSSWGCTMMMLNSCRDVPLLQLDRRNENDAQLFVKTGNNLVLGSKGFIGNSGRGGLDGYTKAVKPNKWHRIALVVDLSSTSEQAKIYVDGRLVSQTDTVDYDTFAQLSEANPSGGGLTGGPNGFLLFADNDGDFKAKVRMSSFLYANKAYTASEISSLGGVTANGIPAPKSSYG